MMIFAGLLTEKGGTLFPLGEKDLFFLPISTQLSKIKNKTQKTCAPLGL